MSIGTDDDRAAGDGTDGVEAPGFADHVITSRETFGWVTADPRQMGALYAYCKLDVLIDLARAVSLDFFDRPLLYTRVDRDVVKSIAALHARYGSDEDHLSREQRRQIFRGAFGPEDESDFARARDGLLEDCAMFAERVFDSGEMMLRARVRNGHRRFKAVLETVYGRSLEWSVERALPALTDTDVYPILRDRGVAGVFGLSAAAAPEFPFLESSDGDKMVEEVSRKLGVPADASLTREHFSALQRAALRGAEAIATVLDYDGAAGDDAALNVLITKCYTWHAALVDLHGVGDVIGTNGNRRLIRPSLPPGPEPTEQPSYVR